MSRYSSFRYNRKMRRAVLLAWVDGVPDTFKPCAGQKGRKRADELPSFFRLMRTLPMIASAAARAWTEASRG